MTTVYFVRHAQAEKVFLNDRMRPLTQEGTQDADKAAEFMMDKHIDAVWSSPYKRAYDTVMPIAMSHGLDIVQDERLCERDPGLWKGDNFLTFIEKQWRDHDYRFEEGESLSDVQKRNIAALNDILVRHSGQTVVVGTHGTALSSILSYYDSSFGFIEFMTLIDYMPYIVKLSFRGEALVSKKDEFIIEKQYR